MNKRRRRLFSVQTMYILIGLPTWVEAIICITFFCLLGGIIYGLWHYFV